MYFCSRYYWIKPACSKIPLRMFCDFQGEGLSYGYIGGIKKETIMRILTIIYNLDLFFLLII